MRVSLILDRIEGGVAVLTDGEMKVYECNVDLLPVGAGEGTALVGEMDDNGNVSSLSVRANPDVGQNRRRLMALFNKNPKNKK